jgi:uncharacterized protein YndB with AHSA1/START domain
MSANKLVVTAEEGKQEVVCTRIFDAPRDLVFKVYTDPEQMQNWWGPRDLKTIVEQMEIKPGGVWRVRHIDADGNEFAFKGVYHDVKSPERLVYTFEFEGMAGHVLLETVTFEDLGDGRTKLIDSAVFQSVEDRDGMVQSGMEHGAAESMDRLEELLAKS